MKHKPCSGLCSCAYGVFLALSLSFCVLSFAPFSAIVTMPFENRGFKLSTHLNLFSVVSDQIHQDTLRIRTLAPSGAGFRSPGPLLVPVFSPLLSLCSVTSLLSPSPSRAKTCFVVEDGSILYGG